MNPTIGALLAQSPALLIRDHPRLHSTISRLSQAGALERRYPGVVVQAGDERSLTRLTAAVRWSDPLGVVHSTTAAQVWLQEPLAAPIELAHPTLRSRGETRVTRHLVPSQFVVRAHGLRLASPSYVAAELAGSDQGRLLSEFLRQGLADQGVAQDALDSFARSPGQIQRRAAMRNCEQDPWSLAEVRLHAILAKAGIGGWVANAAIRLDGQVFHPDVLFEPERLVLEFDGRASHQDSEQFLRDRERQNLLILAGYRVLRFTWEHLDEPQYVVASIRQARATTYWRGTNRVRPAD
jgi:NADH:ubiquinone oxidoreductase 20 kD subunit and related Fe-S oxidoreductases